MAESKKEVSGSSPSSATTKPAITEKAKSDSHILEDMYPDAHALFSAHPIPDIMDPSVLVALDTSALLLPYDMKKATSLQDLGKAYQTLTKGNRLFIPARAV